MTMSFRNVKGLKYILVASGIFIVVLVAIYFRHHQKIQAIQDDKCGVMGVIMGQTNMHWKTVNMICYQFRVGDSLYIDNVGVNEQLLTAKRGQSCMVNYDCSDPRNAVIGYLVDSIGIVVDLDTFQGKVILLNGQCNFDQ